MYQNEYEKTLERIKTAIELAKDYNNLQLCERNLLKYERTRAWNCLQDMFHEYSSQIEIFGLWIDGIHLIKGVSLDQISDQMIKVQLQYIASHIPVYVLIKKGEEDLAKKINHWLDDRARNSNLYLNL